METQKNRQKNGPGQPSAGKDRVAETAMMEGETVQIDAELKDKTGTSSFFYLKTASPLHHPLRN